MGGGTGGGPFLVARCVHITDVDYKDLASNPDKIVAGAEYVPKARKKRRSSSGSASSATAPNSSSKKRSKKSSAKETTVAAAAAATTTTNHNSSNENDYQSSAVPPTNHERIPEVVVQKVFVSYFESAGDDRSNGSSSGPRNDM